MASSCWKWGIGLDPPELDHVVGGSSKESGTWGGEAGGGLLVPIPGKLAEENSPCSSKEWKGGSLKGKKDHHQET